MPGRVPSEQEVLGYFDSCSNWGKWGTEDQMGTLNYITPQKRLQAVALAAEGISIGCSRPLQPSSDADVTVSPLLHYMVRTGERWAGQPTPPGVMQASSDFIGMVFHTFSVTHIDALCHVFRDGKMYNGVPAEQVTAGEKAAVQSVETLRDGIVTRGVLLERRPRSGSEMAGAGRRDFPRRPGGGRAKSGGSGRARRCAAHPYGRSPAPE